MGKFVVFILIFFFSCSGFSQYDVTNGEWVKRKKSVSHQGFLFADSNFVYSIDFQNNTFSGKQNLTASAFSTNSGNYSHSIELNSNAENTREKILTEIFSLNSTFITVARDGTSPKDKNKLTLKQTSTSGVLLKELIIHLVDKEKRLDNDVQIITDKQENSFIVLQNIPTNETQKQHLIIDAYDSLLQKKWSRTLNFPNEEKQYLVSEILFDGESTVYFTAKHILDFYQPNIAFSKQKQNTSFLFKYNSDTKKINELELKLKDRFIVELKAQHHEGELFLAGLFSNFKSYHPNGVFNLKLDSNFRISSHLIHDFTELENNSFTVRKNTKSVKNNERILLKGLEILDNGDFVLIGEEFKKEWYVPNDQQLNSSNYTETFYYGNILLFRFDQKSNLKKSQTIRKSQTSTNDEGQYSSILISKRKNDIILFYNDNPKNINLESGINQKAVASGKKTSLTSKFINRLGTTSQKSITSPSRSLKIRPMKGIQLNNGQTYFLSQKRRKMSLIIVHTSKK